MTGPGGVPVQESRYAASVTNIDTVHIAGVLCAIISRITRIMRVGKGRGIRECFQGQAQQHRLTLLHARAMDNNDVFQLSSAGTRDGGG